MDKIKSITFDYEAQNNISLEVWDKMREDRKQAEKEQLILHGVTKRFVLLKGKAGHVFWTTNLGDIDNDFNKILFESDNQDEIIEQWEKHNPNVW